MHNITWDVALCSLVERYQTFAATSQKPAADMRYSSVLQWFCWKIKVSWDMTLCRSVPFSRRFEWLQYVRKCPTTQRHIKTSALSNLVFTAIRTANVLRLILMSRMFDIHVFNARTDMRFAFKARSQNCEKRLIASSCLSVYPFVRKEQLRSHWTDFHEIWPSSSFTGVTTHCGF